MSNILDARENLMRKLRGANFSPSFKHAFAEWISGHPSILKKNFPETFRLLGQPADFQSALLEYTACLEIDEIQRIQEKNAKIVKPLILAENQTSSLDRSFDIVFNYDLLVKLEMLPRNCGILGPDRNLIESRKEANKQCLVGFILVVHRNNIFKKYNSFKKGPNKTVTIQDVMIYCKARYDFGSLESTRRDLDHCIELALNRIPGLREFDERNYQKNQTKFKNQKS